MHISRLEKYCAERNIDLKGITKYKDMKRAENIKEERRKKAIEKAMEKQEVKRTEKELGNKRKHIMQDHPGSPSKWKRQTIYTTVSNDNSSSTSLLSQSEPPHVQTEYRGLSVVAKNSIMNELLSDEQLQSCNNNESFINETGEHVVSLQLDMSEDQESISEHLYTLTVKCGNLSVNDDGLDIQEYMSQCHKVQQTLNNSHNTSQFSTNDRNEDCSSLKLLSPSDEECIVNELQEFGYSDSDMCNWDMCYEASREPFEILSNLAFVNPNQCKGNINELTIHNDERGIHPFNDLPPNQPLMDANMLPIHMYNLETVPYEGVAVEIQQDIAKNPSIMVCPDCQYMNDEVDEQRQINDIESDPPQLKLQCFQPPSKTEGLLHENDTQDCKPLIQGQNIDTETAISHVVLSEEGMSEEISPLSNADSLPPMAPSPDMGHGTIFKKSSEKEMKLYLQECNALYVPRSQPEFRQDLHFYYKWSTMKKLEKRHTRRPVFSKLWFDCFKVEQNWKFPSQQKARNEWYKILNNKEWYEDKVAYIKSCNNGELLPDSTKAFIMECECLVLNTSNPSSSVHLLVSAFTSTQRKLHNLFNFFSLTHLIIYKHEIISCVQICHCRFPTIHKGT